MDYGIFLLYITMLLFNMLVPSSYNSPANGEQQIKANVDLSRPIYF